MALEHDEICRAHDKELTIVQTGQKTIERDLDQAIERMQELVDQYHGQNVVQAEMNAKLDSIKRDVCEIKRTLAEKVAPLADFISLRNQVWAGIAIIVIGVISALVKFVLLGGLSLGAK